MLIAKQLGLNYKYYVIVNGLCVAGMYCRVCIASSTDVTKYSLESMRQYGLIFWFCVCSVVYKMHLSVFCSTLAKIVEI